MLSISGFFMQCNKDVEDLIPDTNQTDTTANNDNNNNNGDNNGGSSNIACQGVADDQIRIGDEIFVRDTETHNSYLNICMEYDFSSSGTIFLKHERSLYFKDGDFINAPAINILLGDVPPPGTTKTYTLDEGMWILPNSEISSAGKARISIDAYYTRNKHKQSWFSNDESGTVEAVADADGNVKFNFSNVKLIQSGGPIDEKMVICGKNVICQK